MFNYLAAKPVNTGGLANLDLQLFAGEETEVTTEETSVDITATPPDITTEEVVPEAPSEVQAEGKQDPTTTQAFSRRLKEETAKASQGARDAFISEQGYEWAGKPITTEAGYKQAVQERDDQDALKALQDKGYPDEEASQIMEDRKFRQEHEVTLKTQANSQRDYAEYLELVGDYADIKDPSQIPPEVWQLKADKGISLLDAQNRIAVRDFKAQLAKTKLDTEQETIKKISKNAATSPGSASDGNVSHQSKSVADMSASEFEAYRDEVSNR